MISKALQDELLLFFERYLAFYQEFLQLETRKYNDMASNCIHTLPDHVKAEEAYMLKSKGLELEREKLLAKTEIPNATFQQLIPLFDLSIQESIKNIYSELSQVLLDFKETNSRCNNLTELRLRRIKTELEKMDNNPELRKLYNARANGSAPPSLLSKKI